MRSSLNSYRSRWIFAGLILLMTIVPVWLVEYPPFYDYPNHLAEAQIVAHYTDARFEFGVGYEIRPFWYLQSNTFSTALLIWLAEALPVSLAGRFVLSLYLVLFFFGFWILLRQAQSSWLLLLLVPVLAYNRAFTAGLLNFSYAVAFAMFAFAVYWYWEKKPSAGATVLLAVLIVLIYSAHLFAWLLVLISISAMAFVEEFRWRTRGGLLLALTGVLPILGLTRPLIAALSILAVAGVWLGALLLKRLTLRPPVLALGALALAVSILIAGFLFETRLDEYIPGNRYNLTQKATSFVQVLALPHQSLKPVSWLVVYNLLLYVLLFTLVGLLLWSFRKETLKHFNAIPKGRALAIGLLGLLYLVIPSRIYEIALTEPRILIFIVLLLATGLRLPANNRIVHVVLTACLAGIFVLGISGLAGYMKQYDQQVREWISQMDLLAPAKNVLVLRMEKGGEKQPVWLRPFNVFYDGQNFSSLYLLDHGGFVSRVFDNGPVQPRREIPVPDYYWPGFDNVSFVEQQCDRLQRHYDAVLTWGNPDEELAARLDACFRPGQHLPNVSIWRGD